MKNEAQILAQSVSIDHQERNTQFDTWISPSLKVKSPRSKISFDELQLNCNLSTLFQYVAEFFSQTCTK